MARYKSACSCGLQTRLIPKVDKTQYKYANYHDYRCHNYGTTMNKKTFTQHEKHGLLKNEGSKEIRGQFCSHKDKDKVSYLSTRQDSRQCCLVKLKRKWIVTAFWLWRVGWVPANTRYSTNVVSMVGQRLRRWPNIETALGECLVFAGV